MSSHNVGYYFIYLYFYTFITSVTLLISGTPILVHTLEYVTVNSLSSTAVKLKKAKVSCILR